MSILNVKRGTATGINNEPVSDGTLLINKETGQAYFDIGNGAEGSRKEIGAIHDSLTVRETLDANQVITSDTQSTNITGSEASIDKITSVEVNSSAVNGDVFKTDSIDNFKIGEQTFKNLLLDLVYPIGSLYWSRNETDPSTLFGGTWTRIKDRFILAAGDDHAVGTTGGKERVTLTGDEIPSHTHIPTNAGSFYTTRGSGTSEINGVSTGAAFDQSESSGGVTRTSQLTSYGGGSSHENMPPYDTFYCWERINSPVEEWSEQ